MDLMISLIVLAIGLIIEYKILQDAIGKPLQEEIKKQNELLEKLINQMNNPKE